MERFEQAIDRCAMKIGAKDADDYLAEWRKAAPYLNLLGFAVIVYNLFIINYFATGSLHSYAG